MRTIQQNLESREILCRLLPNSHAFSAMMDPMVEPFTELAAKVRQQKPSIPWLSSLTGTWVSEQVAPEASYWARQSRHMVRFGQAVETAIQQGATAFLEVRPGQALSQFVPQQPSKPEALSVLASLGAGDTSPADLETMLASLGRLWLLGLEPDWDGFYSSEKRQRVPLPTYPFERKRYWIEPASAPKLPASVQQVRPESGDDALTNRPAAVPNGGGLSLAPARALQPVLQLQPPTLENGHPDARLVIEKQIQLMKQQIEMLRNRNGSRGMQQ